MAEFVFDEIVGIYSRPATLLKRSFHKGGFPADTSELQVHFQKGLM